MALTAAAIVGAAATAASAGSSIAKGASSGGGKLTAAEFNDYNLRYLAEQLYDNPNAQPPTLSTTQYQPYSWLQDFTPQVVENPYIGQVYQMSDDQASLDAQRQALAQEAQLARGGLTPTDMQNLASIQQQQMGAGQSAVASAQDQLRQRGLGGAGAEYAAMLQGNQGAANNAQQLYDSAFNTALQRQQTAIQNAGTMAGNIRQQSDSVSQQMAAINNNFNTQVANIRNAAANNAVNIRNAATAANLAGRQGVANENVDVANRNADLTRQIQQQQFNNQMQWISGKANAMNNQANYFGALDAAQAQQRYGAGQSLNQGLKSLGDLASSKTGQAAINKVGDWLGSEYNAWNTGANNSPAVNSSAPDQIATPEQMQYLGISPLGD